MKYKKIIVLLSIIFSLCTCFFAYAYWTDKLKLKMELRVNYSLPIVVLEDETEEEIEEKVDEDINMEDNSEEKAIDNSETKAIEEVSENLETE